MSELITLKFVSETNLRFFGKEIIAWPPVFAVLGTEKFMFIFISVYWSTGFFVGVIDWPVILMAPVAPKADVVFSLAELNILMMTNVIARNSLIYFFII